MKYSKLIYRIFLLFPFCILVLFSCVKKESFNVKIGTVSGTVEVLRGGTKSPAQKDAKVESGDIFRTGEGASVSIHILQNRVVYLNENSKVKIEYVWEVADSALSVTVSLANGEVFSEYLQSADFSSAYALSTPFASIIGKESSFDVEFHGKRKVTNVMSFDGRADVYPVHGERVTVPECNKILVTDDGRVSSLVSIMEEDIKDLSAWVDNDRVASLIAASGCSGEPKEDMPPVWEGEPKKSCKPGAALTDNLIAKDPEGQTIRYFLVRGPQGMTLSETDGVLKYKPKNPGTYEVEICAEDETGNTTPLHYFITVVGRLNAVVRVSGMVKAGEELSINASRSVNAQGKREGLEYRFDVNGDGRWDYPKSGTFGKEAVVSHTYTRQGKYTVKVQVKDQEGKTDMATRSVEVTVPPQIQIVTRPEYGLVGTEYTLSVKGKDPAKKFIVRWDLNGDGRWDYPSDASFTDKIEIRHLWDKPGSYSVIVEAEDADKNRVTAKKLVSVYQGIMIEALKGPDTVNINEKVSITCVAKDPKFKIIEYAWDYAGVGMFNKKTKQPTVTCSYKKAGIYTFVCSITNEKGMSASASKDIVVLNFTTTIDAGGPYKTFVNKKFTVKGLAKDVDNKIVSYMWDLDNDKKYEVTSGKTSVADHVYKRQGTYVVRFAAKLDDGSVHEDTAVVNVENHKPKAFAGDDIVSRKKKKIALNGVGKDPDNNIAKYEWDFNGDGTFDWNSKDTGYTEHEFLEYSAPVLKVTDTEGGEGYDTVRIIICPKGMKTIDEDLKYCIDKYEYPNRKDEIAVSNVTYNQAAAKCKKAGKRLCTYKEMVKACQGGKTKYAYPYGKRYEPDFCNSYGNRKVKNKKAVSGLYLECVSKYGVFDMSGNVAEWVSTGDKKTKYAVGGWWQNDEKRARCDSFIPLNKNKKFHYVGFRCCK